LEEKKMSQLKRLVGLLVLGAILATMFAACGPEATSLPEPTSAPQEAEAPQEVEEPAEESNEASLSGEIDFWVYEPGTPDGMAVLDQLKADFEAANPGTTVNIIPVPKNDFNTKLNTAIAAGTEPDASYLDQPLVARFAADGVLAIVPADLIDESTLYQGALNTNRVGDELYGLPLSQTCVAMYYNKDLVPTPPDTWDELMQVAEEVYDPDNQIAAFAVPSGDGWGAWLFPGFVATAGGQMLDEKNQVVSFAEQPAIDALQLWQDLLVYSPREITDSENSFQTGHVAMMITGPWELQGLRENWPDLNWGVALIPKKTVYGSNIGGDNAVVYESSENKAVAWAWLKFLTDYDPNVLLSLDVMGNFPINLAAAEGDWLAGDAELAVFMEQMKYAQARPTVADWLKINDEVVAAAIEEALENGGDPATALQDAGETAKEILGW
jgi:multiple sugar transport system substrate-binding protein